MVNWNQICGFDYYFMSVAILLSYHLSQGLYINIIMLD